MPRPGWNGTRVTNAIRHVTTRDRGTCWLCGHPGANSLDHIQPAADRPDLQWTPSNWKAAHLNAAGTPKGCQVDGCTCPGNTGRGRRPPKQPSTRRW